MKKIFTVMSMLLMSLCLSANAAPPAAPFTKPQQEQIEKIVHQYLLRRPEILMEVANALQKQKMELAQADAMQAIKANKEAIFSDKNDPVYGNKNGDIKIVEFYDYQCGHCKMMAPIIDKIISQNKNVKVISKDFPIFGDNSIYAAKATIAAYQLNKEHYAEFHRLLMQKSDPLNKKVVNALAEKSDYNVSDISKAANQQQVADQVAANIELAKKMKLIGTPAFVLTNKDMTKFLFIPGATSEGQLQDMINSLQ